MNNHGPAALIDIDGNGQTDLLVGRQESIIWYEQSQNGIDFIERQDIRLEFLAGSVQRIKVADFDRDGPSTTAATIADVDGDGDLDSVFATCDHYCNTPYFRGNSWISWSENLDGKGTFSERRELAQFETRAEIGIRDLYVRDLDGDGDADIVVPNSREFHWIENLDRSAGAYL